MKQRHNTGLETVLFYSRVFFMTTLLLGTNAAVYASGAKLPEVATNDSTAATDGTVANSTNSDDSSETDTGSADTGSVALIAEKYSHLDPDHEVPATLLRKALNYYDSHPQAIANKRVIGVIDFKQHNSKERFYIIDMDTGQVDKYLVAHGKNSDPDYNGYATIFSNSPGSEASSIGFYLSAETYNGNHGYSLKLDGLSSTNSNARRRAIVIHPADYVTPGRMIGRSWGCPALDPRYSALIINQIKGGALIYASNVY